jgi:hypothetical protein
MVAKTFLSMCHSYSAYFLTGDGGKRETNEKRFTQQKTRSIAN